jgi:Carboxypeptidase regulatory-like domain/TonB dependent receptor
MRVRVFASFLLCAAAFAQSDRGTITGTISDPAGAVVAAAPIEARSTETGATYQAASSGTGNYTLAQLPAGPYELTVTVTGFKKFVRQNIVISVASTMRVDVTLEVGSATESVTVSEAAPLLKTESGELSHNMTTDRVNSLPVINLGAGGGIGNVRNPLQAINLIPGSAFSNDNTLRVNGMPANTQAIRIEGQDATNGQNRQTNQINQASLDAIQEVTVQTSNFAAEYGQAGGGYFNYTMKSGSNQLHGSAYDYFVNEAMNAGTPFTDAGRTNSQKAGQHIRNAQRRNNYGFTIGGPVYIPNVYNGHDKTFFFFSFEQFRENQNISDGLKTVPTVAYRNGNFNAAQLNQLTIGGQPAVDALGRALFENQIFDPGTTRVAPDGSFVRDSFAGNIIPLSRMDPVALKVQSLIPLPLNSNLVNNYPVPAYLNSQRTTIPSFKIDHNLNSTMKLSWYYSDNRNFTPRNDGMPFPITAAVGADNKSKTTRINYDQSVTPTMLLHLGVGLMYMNQNFLPELYDTAQLGWGPGQRFSASKFFPNFLWGGNTATGGFAHESSHFNPFENGKDIKTTSNASVTWVRGNHTMKFGGEMMFEGFPTVTHNRAHGRLSFGQNQTANTWEDGRGTNRNTGFAYASYLLGAMSGYTNGATAALRFGNHNAAMYAQDSWKVTRKLTLDYGLRWDYVTLIREQYGRNSSLSVSTPNELAGNRLGKVIFEATCNCRFAQNYKFAFGPRLGSAYQIDSKTVLRAGAGLTYGPSQTAGAARGANDFVTVDVPGFGEPAGLLVDGNPLAPGNRFGNAPLVWPDFTTRVPQVVAPNVVLPASVFFHIDRNAGRPGRIFQWSVGLQRQVTQNLVVEASYVGNRGVWWAAPVLSAGDLNGLEPTRLRNEWGLDITNPTDRALLTTRMTSPAVQARFPQFRNAATVYPGFPLTRNLNQALRDRPHMLGSPGFFGPPIGNTWYDSLQVKVTKRMTHGLTVDSAFTFQKELNLGVGADTSYLGQPGTNAINDVYNRMQNKQLAGQSRPFMLVTSFRYTTPSISGMKALSYALRNWNIAGVLRYQSGEPIRTPASNNGLLGQLARTDNPGGFGGGRTTWNAVAGVNPLLVDPNCKCFDPTTQLVLNPAAWTDAPGGQWGTAAPYYNNYRWQRQPSESLSLGRTFGLAKDGKIKFDVRAELFNVFNRLYLSNPTIINTGANNGPNAAAPTVRNNQGARSRPATASSTPLTAPARPRVLGRWWHVFRSDARFQ